MTSRVVEGALDPAGLVLGTEDPASGALVVVTGTRDRADGPAADGTLRELEDEALDRFDVRRCRLRVRADAAPGEAAAAAAVRAPHRRAAFDAARWAVTTALGRLPDRGGP